MSEGKKIKFITLENAYATRVCRQHAVIETSTGGNKVVCCKMMASDDGDTPLPFVALDDENLNLDKLCKRCAKILSLPNNLK